ncbi:LysR family transcriptional regulator [Bordetella sp. BOR01]|uniref:LysR family transcriptional regulator n=1 Tax=Bordetella sp. BOR01 TaxID=2854779 RepID=UPI001C45B610|nr:LysR family transcriptional regulator [Bordetella sp. BOR01]MBV7481433.1 LysR family transcriptional regulator [Bordetella sp. BOR01]
MIAKNVDLNLLLVFDAVLAEKNVTRAARRLGASQSAVSKGLAQLRIVFGDALFLRDGRGVVPTHKALEIAEHVRQAILALNALVSPADAFDAQTARAHFDIGATDYVSLVLLPVLVRKLSEVAPAVSLTVHAIDHWMPEEMLLAGKADLVLSSVSAVTFPLYRQALFDDGYVCLCREHHPLLADTLTVEQFASCRHLSMPRQNGARERVLQDVMQRMGVSREVTVQVPHMLAIPATLAATDLIATLALRVARTFAQLHALRIVPHPLPLGSFSVSQIWHDRTHKSAPQQWLRGVIASVAAGL